jgi:hypothetical protein
MAIQASVAGGEYQRPSKLQQRSLLVNRCAVSKGIGVPAFHSAFRETSNWVRLSERVSGEKDFYNHFLEKEDGHDA